MSVYVTYFLTKDRPLKTIGTQPGGYHAMSQFIYNLQTGDFDYTSEYSLELWTGGEEYADWTAGQDTAFREVDEDVFNQVVRRLRTKIGVEAPPESEFQKSLNHYQQVLSKTLG